MAPTDIAGRRVSGMRSATSAAAMPILVLACICAAGPVFGAAGQTHTSQKVVQTERAATETVAPTPPLPPTEGAVVTPSLAPPPNAAPPVPLSCPAPPPAPAPAPAPECVPPDPDLLPPAEQPFTLLGIPFTLGTTIFAAIAALFAAATVFIWMQLIDQRAVVGDLEDDLAKILGRKQGISIDQTPEILRRVMKQAEELLTRNELLEAAHGNAPSNQPKPKQGSDRDSFRATLFHTTIAMVNRVIALLRDQPAGALVGQLNSSLSIEAHLKKAVAVLEEAASAGQGPGSLIEQLERGKLDELLTFGPLLNEYFPDLGIVPVALDAISRLVSSILAADQVTIRMQRPLTSVAIGTPGTEPFDRRGIRKVEPVRKEAARKARTLGEGELLVVDCTSPGWTGPGRAAREPTSTIFDPASWT